MRSYPVKENQIQRLARSFVTNKQIDIFLLCIIDYDLHYKWLNCWFWIILNIKCKIMMKKCYISLMTSQAPDPNIVVPGGGGDCKPCRGHWQLGDAVVMPRQHSIMSANNVPHVDSGIITRAKDEPAWVGDTNTCKGGVWCVCFVLTHFLLYNYLKIQQCSKVAQH